MASTIVSVKIIQPCSQENIVEYVGMWLCLCRVYPERTKLTDVLSESYFHLNAIVNSPILYELFRHLENIWSVSSLLIEILKVHQFYLFLLISISYSNGIYILYLAYYC